jgi:hypothetical protein
MWAKFHLENKVRVLREYLALVIASVAVSNNDVVKYLSCPPIMDGSVAKPAPLTYHAILLRLVFNVCINRDQFQRPASQARHDSTMRALIRRLFAELL